LTCYRIITTWLTLRWVNTVPGMPKHLNFCQLIPSFKGLNTFKPLLPVREEYPLDLEIDPSLTPEEKGTIMRYLKYAETLLNASDETPGDNEPEREVALMGKRSTDKKVA
jgi:hypothetical protein